jgi:uncharacterized membrane protein
MSAESNIRTGKPAVFSDVYTALLALAFAVVLSTAIFMMVKCMSEYGTLFAIARP